MTAIYSGRCMNGLVVYALRDDQGNVRYLGKGAISRAVQNGAQRGLNFELLAVNLNDAEATELEARFLNLLAPKLDNIQIPAWPGLPAPSGDTPYEVTARLPDHDARTLPGVWSMAKLFPEDIPTIRAGGRSKEERFELAKRYGVHPSTIKAVQERRSWPHVPEEGEESSCMPVDGRADIP